MSIEKNLERIAVSLETIALATAAHVATDAMVKTAPAAAQSDTPAPTPPPTGDVDTRSPQQKAADTRKANKLKKEAEAGNVVPIAPPVATPPVAAPATAPLVEPPLEGVLDFPADLAGMTALTIEIFTQLGPRGPEVGALLANTYGVSHVNDLPVEYYAGFTRDLRALVVPA